MTGQLIATAAVHGGLKLIIKQDGLMMSEFIVVETLDTGADYNISLRWSGDKGRTWGNAVEQSLGHVGEYATSVSYRRLGLGRDRIFELSWSTPHNTSLLGAHIITQEAIS